MANKIKVLFLNVQENKQPEAMEIEDDIHTFYKLIGCEGIDVVRRYISGKWYRVICDDTGRMKPRPKLSMCDTMLDYPIAGNIIIAGVEDRFGELTSLTDADVEMICDRKLKWQAQWIITQADTVDGNRHEFCTYLKPIQPGEIQFIPLEIPKKGGTDDED